MADTPDCPSPGQGHAVPYRLKKDIIQRPSPVAFYKFIVPDESTSNARIKNHELQAP